VADYRGPLHPGDTSDLAEREGRRARDLDPESLSYLLGLYDGEVRFADANVGALLDRLRDADLHRPVLTVLTADHGEEFLDHGGTSHGYTLYDEQVRVPLIIHFPARLPPGRVRPQVRLIDVVPTVLDLTGVGHAVARTQGASLVALARGEVRRGPGDALSEAPLRGVLRSVRTDAGWKLVDAGGSAPVELFDLIHDPGERTDLAADKPVVASALSARAERGMRSNARQRAALDLDRSAPTVGRVGEALRQRLEALGYVASTP
jgi:arylsulfatase A-like enzyme